MFAQYRYLLFSLLVLGMFFVAGPAFAQQDGNGTVTGVVLDSARGTPLPGSNVQLLELERGTSTDRNGRFRMENVPTDEYTLLVTYIGRKEKSRTVSVRSNETTQVEVALIRKATGMGEVSVSASPIVGSQEAALARQKAAPVVKNVIASDQVGKFPDQNAAAAISRVPGVAIQRDQGQARYVNLRGTPQRWTRLAINGLNVIGSEGRVVRFDEIPAPIISSTEVTKAIAPDKPASAIAGRINVETASAFDNPGFHVNGEVSPGYMGMSRDLQYDVSAQVSNTWN